MAKAKTLQSPEGRVLHVGDGSWSTQGTGNRADDEQGSDLKGPSFLLKVMGERGVTPIVRKSGRACPLTEAQHVKYQLYCTLQHIINVHFVISLAFSSSRLSARRGRSQVFFRGPQGPASQFHSLGMEFS